MTAGEKLAASSSIPFTRLPGSPVALELEVHPLWCWSVLERQLTHADGAHLSLDHGKLDVANQQAHKSWSSGKQACKAG